MIPRECKRLAEVDFPIAEVSRQAVREKSIRHGHPSTLHLWWARRPLASSRAVLMALLLPDPCDPQCPTGFKSDARRIMLGMHGRPQGWTEKAKSDEGLRRIILEFIARFANWDNAANDTYLKVSRALVEAAHGDESPLVVDPFAGGGSIPLEALRVGCEAFASDLNPVACLILKVLLEDIPRHGMKLADELLRVGTRIKKQARQDLSDLYPVDSDGATPIAYLWARTARCEAPSCGAEIPLIRSFWLGKKAKRKRALRHRVRRPKGRIPKVEFEIFEPTTEGDVQVGTVTQANATCLCCGIVLPAERVRTQLAAQHGGADVVFDAEGSRVGGARLTAVVTLRPGEIGRHYRLPTEADYEAVAKAQKRVTDIDQEWETSRNIGDCPIPDEPLPPVGTLGFRVQRYGMLRWGDLFTARQKITLDVLAKSCESTEVDWIARTTSLSLSGVADRNVSLATWRPQADQEKVEHLFARQALSMTWDFGEAVPLSSSTGSFSDRVDILARTITAVSSMDLAAGQIHSADATAHPLPDQAAGIWFTDPPYYDAVPYADLSDFFLVWLKRALPDHAVLRDPYDSENPLAPKSREAVQDKAKVDQGRTKDREWFEETMARAFTEGRRVLHDDGVGSVVFAHKTTEGWEALLSGMIRGGWTITGSWPIATEMTTRLRARDSAALATSVHLVCRPRPEDAPTGDWADVLRELPKRVGAWMEHLQDEGVRGADLVFACVGPALEVFSRYSRVETSEGDEIGLPKYLQRVWEEVGRTALENVLGTEEAQARNGQAGVLEEDARLTALFLWTLQSTEGSADNGSTENGDESAIAKAAAKGFTLPFDVVRRFAQPMGINLDKWTERIIEQKKGTVRLLPVTLRAQTLFGQDGAQGAAEWIESDPAATVQQTLFPELEQPSRAGMPRRGKKSIISDDVELQSLEATALDRVHAAMLLQSSGHSNALRRLIEAELDRGPEFLRLANALSALYPRGSEEKRLLDGMLLAVPR